MMCIPSRWNSTTKTTAIPPAASPDSEKKIAPEARHSLEAGGICFSLRVRQGRNIFAPNVALVPPKGYNRMRFAANKGSFGAVNNLAHRETRTC